ncbi:MAG: hypothetical protein JSS65_12635 [Armatimonadetes bacterium]|nr:hypothetical protein [Armatimonadota bacterium]
MPARVRDRRGLEITADDESLDRLAGVTGLHRLLRLLKAKAKPVETCPACGTTLASVRQTGLLGCGLCYSVFEIELKLNKSAPAKGADLVS